MASFQPGQHVRVRVDNPPHHYRTPAYVQGKVGVVERLWGEFRNPESLGHGGDGLPKKALYAVKFAQPEVWGSYRGPARDTVVVDLYEHWLIPTEGA